GKVLSREEMARTVRTRDVISRDGVVSGMLDNVSGRPLRDVQLSIHHMWLWEDERRPGIDDRSRLDTYTVPGIIPPGGSVPFSFRPESPLDTGSDGHFESVVQVIGVTELPQATTAAPAPPAGDA